MNGEYSWKKSQIEEKKTTRNNQETRISEEVIQGVNEFKEEMMALQLDAESADEE